MNRTITLRHMLWLSASMVMVAAPHVQRMPWWLTLLACTLLIWALYLARTRLPQPHRSIFVLIVLGSTAGVYLHYGAIFGRDAGVALLVVMLGLKALETKTLRDGMLLVFLCYFLVITNFLYSQTIPTALYMFACVWLITASMIGLHYIDGPRASRHQWQTAGVLLAQSVPLMLVLFVLFPRVQGPLWGMPSDSRRATTGLSDTMAPGSLSELTLSEAVAFRATFQSAMPPVNRLYWRGPVLWDYDGRTWRAPRPVFGAPEHASRSLRVEYSVTVEPHGKPWLFALDVPGSLPPNTLATRDFQLLSTRPVTTRLRYDMVSFLDYEYGGSNGAEDLERASRLPPGFNPRTLALARQLRSQHRDDRALVQAVLTRFNSGGFSYTLSPPPLGEHSVDEFLFSTKSGFCEYYASAFAVLMRAAGIPARIVTGYQGGEMNPFGDYLIVRQADAHAWTEVWLKDAGWVRVDPTAAVAPARIERGSSATAAAGGALPLFMRTDLPVLRELRLTLDSLANTWNQWVLGYTPERQRSLLIRVGLDDATWQTLAGLLLAAAGIVTMVLAWITLRRLRVRVRDPVKLAYNAFCDRLRRLGLPRHSMEGPLSYAERIAHVRPDLDAHVRRFIALYVALRYAGVAGAHNVARLQQLAREFRPRAPRTKR